jgi:hypothetical protein
MRRVVVLAALVAVVWVARDARWLRDLGTLVYSSPHEEYVAGLEQSGMSDSPLALAWIAASANSVAQPTVVTLPHRRRLAFVGERPAAYAFRLTLNRGQRVDAMVDVTTDVPTTTFVDVFELGARVPSHEGGSFRALTHEAASDGDVIVRVQPELLRDGQLEVTLRAARGICKASSVTRATPGGASTRASTSSPNAAPRSCPRRTASSHA